MTTDLRDPLAVCAALGVNCADIIRTTWPQSARTFTPGAFYLKEDWVRQTCQTLRFDPGVTDALAEAAAATLGNLPLERLLWHCRWLICDSGYEPKIGEWPEFPDAMGPAGLLFYGLLTLSAYPHMLAIHAGRGIELEDTIESLASLETWILDYKRLQGVWRFPRMGWLQHHVRGNLHKLGRLEYLPGSYYHNFRWYRHTASGRVIALAEDGCLFRPDGQFASADGGEVWDNLWRSRLTETLETITGNPVSPLGHVLPKTVTLDTSEWCEVLRKGDPVVTVHIPAKGSMDYALCGESFVHARDFYAKHFPDLKYRAFTCTSWLLDPQFEHLSPSPPNISACLAEWYLHPAEGARDQQTWERIFDLFGGSKPDWANAPRDTSLRRAVIDFELKGGHLRGSGAVIFPEDLDWGKQVYRSTFASEVME
ncbi:MAG: acyltransferase domain-containing protein [Armatimonadia bacterium]